LLSFPFELLRLDKERDLRPEFGVLLARPIARPEGPATSPSTTQGFIRLTDGEAFDAEWAATTCGDWACAGGTLNGATSSGAVMVTSSYCSAAAASIFLEMYERVNR
jgi:hypothetical protein